MLEGTTEAKGENWTSLSKNAPRRNKWKFMIITKYLATRGPNTKRCLITATLVCAASLSGCQTSPTYHSPPPTPMTEAERAYQAKRNMCLAIANGETASSMRLAEKLAKMQAIMSRCMARE